MAENGTTYRAELIMPYGTGDVVVTPHDYESPLRRGNRLTKAGWQSVLRRIVTDFSNDGVVDRAAAMTYYSLLSVAPMLLAAYSIFSLLMPRKEDAPDSLLADLIQTYVPPELQDDALRLLLTIVGTPSQSTIALVVSGVFSLWSASGYVRSFSRTANLMYGRTEGRPIAVTWITMWLVTLVLVVGAVVIILGALLTDGIVTAVLGPVARPLQLESELEYLTSIFLPVWDYLRGPVIAVVAVALVSVLYHFTPNVRPGRFRVLTLGSTLALATASALWVGFGWYLRYVGVRSTYGAFGTVLAVLVLVWAMNVVLLMGVKIDAEVLRAKELQAGFDSRRCIQAPPRSNSGAAWRLQMRRWTDRAGEEILDG
ncbi:YihY/virulence factor BrkB family protein [Corynebacterium ureicelerivorans]|uniref:YihY/virulence factor BrkB family protein n=1 Tax=Corynebacterium ureicelerivorans TaxID=401472 RepID=UPI00264F89B4|nr:YihY/virulence factor BrkB family protein [Corynebacterium ureicelerivorans]MDN8604714.1 YihY/virulence factor BrkB family protein [Corynebacterium ureicelerivorans]